MERDLKSGVRGFDDVTVSELHGDGAAVTGRKMKATAMRYHVKPLRAAQHNRGGGGFSFLE